ncbi:MAG: ABC transporter ATP-binding protein [Cellvibrio sp.]
MSSYAMVDVREVTKKVDTQEGELQLLHSISLQVAKGQSLAITGPSGSGKSTLLGLLAGLDTPTTGDILLAGESLTQLDEDGRAKVRAEHVGFVFQSFQLLPGLTALENVMLPLELKGESNAKAQAIRYLEKVGLAERLQHYPQQLSGGEQQRVAIARAFVTRPKVLFADEPTGNLDSVTGEKIINLLFDLNEKEGTTLILVTHEERLAQRCERRVHVVAGEIINKDEVLLGEGTSQ